MKKIFTFFGLITAAASMNAQIVINEVYGGGGNSGATLKNDFVELINRGTTTVTLTGAYLQYASANGVFGPTTATGSASNPLNNKLALPTITLNPGQKYLIQLAAGNGGTVDLPTPDFAPNGTTVPNAPLGLSGTGGKIAITTDSENPTAANGSNVIDFVGWSNTANLYEGTGPAPATTNTTSISRNNGADTNNNSADFTAGVPTPQNSASGTLAVSDLSKANGNFVRNSFVKNNEIIFGAEAKDVKVYTMSGQLVKTASVKENESVSVAELAKGNYIVTGTVNNKPVSQKILKD